MARGMHPMVWSVVVLAAMTSVVLAIAAIGLGLAVWSLLVSTTPLLQLGITDTLQSVWPSMDLLTAFQVVPFVVFVTVAHLMTPLPSRAPLSPAAKLRSMEENDGVTLLGPKWSIPRNSSRGQLAHGMSSMARSDSRQSLRH
uniref:Uncharacterized protein n=2 Tax=Rhizochromulina marina TaxID=1034831 RepID=A0A7S2W0X3_9STRA|mmetsp:Transcript_11534/g.33309  ORF Transcript_11534/g.33309 Transcript_11534/m.33309 type:complete len:142 (+) Transcript_11534:57-482(+)|eukprot:CAMPEP_0118973356 /NCGR_PEP_ID=MMETSP1173-20130426/9868_1 /TAXON_ID=1034831 /ORGANISM="Rhizochromulina marina cf, Strain CCMP1243" /LENGTH=141 /DNA_ID=CAMNT_0006922989 /DNA_START=57 /DNA_END=482 /DNA_ORIENTATION=+